MGMVGFEAPSPEDAAELRALIAEHASAPARPSRRGCSSSARSCWRGAFVKVMPHDYRRVLREQAEAEAAD